MTKKVFISVLFSFVLVAFAYGQTDREFWFAAPRVTTGHGTGGIPLYIRLASGDIAAQVTISVPANPAFDPIFINLPANTAHTEDISALRAFFENEPFDAILSKGIHIESTNLITAYYEVGTHLNPDIFALKGKNALGEEFFVPFQNFFANGNYTPQAYSSILIVATEDNTTVTITPSRDAYPNRAAGVPFDIVLNKGQTYAVVPNEITAGGHPRPGQLPENRLTGTHIVSDNPIAVTTADDSVRANEANDWGCRDLIGDQIVPVNIIGDKYVAMRGRLYQPPDDDSMLESFYVIATQPSTQVFVDGVLRTTINAGISYRHEFTQQTHYIESSAPVYVYHVAGFGCEMGGALLPPISICTGSLEVSFTRSKAESFFLNILVRAGAEDGFSLNGAGPNTIINEAIFNPIPGTDQWLAGELELSDVADIPLGVASLIKNEKDVFHLGIINGGRNSGTMYGYFSNFNELEIESVIADVGTDIELFCYGYPIQLIATGGTSYMWDPPDFLDDPLSSMPTALPDTTIRYTVTVSGACEMVDQASITLVITDPIKALFSTDKIVGCSPLDVTIYDHSLGITNYSWRFGDGVIDNVNLDEFTYTYINDTDEPQDYLLMLVGRNPNFCVDTMYTYITVKPETRAIAGSNIISGCAPLKVDFENSSTGASTYLWRFGDGGATTGFTPSHTFHNYSDTDTTYTVVLKATSEYGCIDYDTLHVNVKPFVKAGFGFDNPTYCSPVEIGINNTSIGATSYFWDFDDGETPLDTSDSFFNYYYNNDGNSPVTHLIRLVTESEYGCVDEVEKPVTIFPNITSSFTTENELEGCSPLQIDFQNLSEGADKYLWNFGTDEGSSFLENPSHTFINNDSEEVKEFFVQLTAESDYGCKDIFDTIIIVYPMLEASFSFDYAEHCAPQEVAFNNLSTGGSSFYWDFGDGNTSEEISPVHTYQNQTDVPQIYTITLNIENDYKCPDVISRTIIINPEVVAAFNIEEGNSGCHPYTVSLQNNSTGASSYYWQFGDGGSSNQANPTRTYYNFSHTSSKTIPVKLTVGSDYGCKNEMEKIVTIYPKPKSMFSPDITQGCAPLGIDFIDQTEGGGTLRWTFEPDSVITSGPGSQSYIFKNNEEDELFYNVELITSNKYGCSDTTHQTINTFPQIDAVLELSEISGCHPLTIEIANLSTGATADNPYQWIYGDGSSSSVTEIAHNHTFKNFNHTQIAEYQLKLKTQSRFGCLDSITKTVHVFPKPKALFTAPDSPICSPAEIYFEDLSLGGALYNWNFDDGNTSGISSSVEHTYYQPHDQDIGFFNPSLIVHNKYGCIDTFSMQLKVYPDISVDYIATEEGCHPLTVNFNNTSLGANSFQWDFGDGNYSNEVNPENIFYNNSFTDIINYNTSLTATSTYGCEALINKEIAVFPKPKSEFFINKEKGCSPLNVNFTNSSIGGDSFLWNLGGEASDIADDEFTKIFENKTEHIVSYELSLTVFNIHGCSSETINYLEVFPEVTALFTTPGNKFSGCTPLSLNFINQSILADKYKWRFGDGASSLTENPSHQFTTTGSQQSVYEVFLEAESHLGCKDELIREIIIYPTPIADFSVSPYQQFYPSTTITLTNLTSEGNWSFLWELGDGKQIITPSRNEIEYTYSWTEGQYQTRYYDVSLKAFDHHCFDTNTKQIVIEAPYPVVGFSPSAQGCPPFEVEFINQSLYGFNYWWDFGDGQTSTQSNPAHVFEEPGRFRVKLIVEGEGGLDSAYQTITVFHPPIADFLVEPKEVQLPHETIKLVNLSSLGATYEWNFGDGNISFDFQPVHLYNEAGSYDITLTVGTDTYPPCYDTKKLQGAVNAEEPCNLIFPNAFTPHEGGSMGGYYVIGDPANHVFHPIHEGVDSYRLEVFNRWGELIFRTTDINIGWDGYYRGKLVPTGVYVYRVWATCTNGGKVNKTGDITVYR